MSISRWCAVAALVVALHPLAAVAQYYGGEVKDAIAGVGAVTLKKTPVAVRVIVELNGTGKNLEEALKNLKEVQAAATTKLEGLGAEKGSVRFGNPSTANAQNAQRAQMETMIRQRMTMKGPTSKLPKGLQAPPSVSVGTTVMAQWPLKGDTAEEVMLAVNALTEKVKAAKVAGQADKKLTAAEEEVAEEMAEMMRDRGEETVQPGEPHFVYLARITPAEREKAMAEAFQKAKAQAVELAKAAGIELGELRGVVGAGVSRTNFYNEYGGGFGYERRQHMQRLMMEAMGQSEDGESSANENETAGVEPGALSFQFGIQASFAIKPAK